MVEHLLVVPSVSSTLRWLTSYQFVALVVELVAGVVFLGYHLTMTSQQDPW